MTQRNVLAQTAARRIIPRWLCPRNADTLFPRKRDAIMDIRRQGAYDMSMSSMMTRLLAKYHLGQVVRHRKHPFRGVIFDVDPEFSNTDEWYHAIPEEARPRKDQPFYHLLAENDDSFYVAYVSEQNLVLDDSGEPVEHPDLSEIFGEFSNGRYPLQMDLN